jgi:hypothetical protein
MQNIHKIVYKKHEHSKHDSDKSEVENINYLLQCEG